MAAHKGILLHSSSVPRLPSLLQQRGVVGKFMTCKASLINNNIPNFKKITDISFSNNLSTTRGLLVQDELNKSSMDTIIGFIEKKNKLHLQDDEKYHNSLVIEKLYEIMEAVADRVEMHNNIGEQRDRWNTLLLTSINTITLAAATLISIDSSSTCCSLSSTFLYLAATGILIIFNKIQPSQLVEEQRNATRLFKQLQNQIQRIITIGTNPTEDDVKEAMDKVLALDKAYPLPLLGSMLDKFPSTVEPAVWWPKNNKNKKKKNVWNGWNGKLEVEMKELLQVIRNKDKQEYLRLGEKALKLNKLLAVTGPLLTGLAAAGSALAPVISSSSCHGTWAAMVGIVGGVLASVVNTVEHGGQVGMVFEMYRNNAGFFKLMEESIETNLSEREVERRENGELLELKVALQLGRSLSELREFASNSSSSSSSKFSHQGDDEFASKLF